MFTWICPQCGKEVPPHHTECPHCAEASRTAARPQSSPPPPPGYVPPPPQIPYQAAQPPPGVPVQAPPYPPAMAPQYPYQGQYAPPQNYPQPPQQPATPGTPGAPQQYYVVAEKRGLPSWLVALLVAAGLIGLGAGAYYFLRSPGAATTAGGQANPLENVPPAAAGAASSNRLAKHLEATGFRISEDERKRLTVKFLVVNHSGADIGDLAGKVHVKTTEGKDIASVNFKTTRLGPYESTEFTVIVPSSLRAYELPDWQFLRAELEITSPSQS